MACTNLPYSHAIKEVEAKPRMAMDQQPSDGTRLTLQQRLQQLADVEKSIDIMLRSAQFCMTELAKEKQIGKSKMDEASLAFRNNLNLVETNLSSNMAYLSNVCVGTPHQGSTFSAHHKMGLAAQCEQSLHSHLARVSQQHFPRTNNGASDEAVQMDTTMPSIDNSASASSLNIPNQ